MHTKQKLDYVPLMNNTKWDEIRLAMCSLTPSPEWRTKDFENGYISEWDKEWFYHFKMGGYEIIEWLEIRYTSPEQKEKIVMELSKIHVPLEVKEETLRIYGFVLPEFFIEYAKL
jgi:hypothetical protein